MKKIIRDYYFVPLIFSICFIFSQNSYSYGELSLETISPTSGYTGQDLNITLKGSGFDENTRVSMFLNVGNKDKVIGSFDTPGHAKGIEVVENLAYVADSESGLQIIDVSNKTSPVLLGTADTPGTARGVTVVSNYAYVADGESWLQVIDVSNPETPILCGYGELSEGQAYNVFIKDNLAYVAAREGDLQVFDVSEPCSPVRVQSVYVDGYAYDVSVTDDRVYVAAGFGGNGKAGGYGGGVEVFDLKNGYPEWIGTFDMPIEARSINIDDNNAYITCGTTGNFDWPAGLAVIDKLSFNFRPHIGATKSTPLDAFVMTPIYAGDVSIAGNRAFVADYSGLHIVDVDSSSTSCYTITGTVEAPGWAYGIKVVDETAYAAYGTSGLQIIDVSTPGKNKGVTNIYIPGKTQNVAAVENRLYAGFDGDNVNGIQITDINDPFNPKLMGTVTLDYGPNEITAVNNTIYSADYEGLSIINASNPSESVITGYMETPGSIMGMAVSGDKIYAADIESGLLIIDISDSSNPVLIGSVETPGLAFRVAVAGNTAYVADNDKGLQIIDISSPTNPIIIGNIDTYGHAYDVAVSGNIAYVADAESGLQVIDVSNPTSPVIITSLDKLSPAHYVKLAGNSMAYVAIGGKGFAALDISAPYNPIITGFVNTPGYAYELEIVNNLAYVADKNSLIATPLPVEIFPVIVNSPTEISFNLKGPQTAGKYGFRVFDRNESVESLAGINISKSPNELEIQSVSTTLAQAGQDLEITLKGSGFDNNTRVSLCLDSVNQKSIMGSVTTPGYAIGIHVQGTKAYVADSSGGLQIIDFSNPSMPVIVGSAKTFDNARDITTSGDLAYVTLGQGGLQIIDIGDPGDCKQIGYIDTPGWAYGITIADDIAYIADGESGLQLIDVNNPYNPFIITSVDTPGDASKVALKDNIAYMADNESGLQVIDISNPLNPFIIASIDTPDFAEDIKIIGDIACVADGKFGNLLTVDISDPLNPEILGTLKLPAAEGLAVNGDNVYVASRTNGLQIADISNPSQPRLIGFVNISEYAMNVAISGDTVCVTDGLGIKIINIKNPSLPNIISNISTDGNARGVQVVGNTAYVLNSNDLKIIDVSDPFNPHIISSVQVASDNPDGMQVGNGLLVSGTTIYVAALNGGLKIIDVSDPYAPAVIGAVETPGYAENISLSGDKAYVSDWLMGLQVIDVSDPSAPQIMGTGKVSAAFNTDVNGNMVYLTEMNGKSLQIFDVSDPYRPEFIGFVHTPDGPTGLVVNENTAYTGSIRSGLQIIDVRNPYYPAVISSIDTPDIAYGIDLADNTVYVADYGGGIQVIDVSNPLKPVNIGSLGTQGFAYDVFVSDNKAYVADTKNGLTIVPVPIEIKSLNLENKSEISFTIPAQDIPGHYSIRVFNGDSYHQLSGAVSYVPPEESYLLNTKAIIIAGDKSDNDIRNETNYSADFAYQALLYQGYTAESIYYLSPDMTSSYADEKSSLANISWAVRQWTIQNPAAAELILFIVGHGREGQFIISDTESLDADILNQWLNELQTALNIPVTVIYDACHSGSFLPKLSSSEEMERIVIASTSSNTAYFLGDGQVSFSSRFWNAVYNGSNLDSAFFYAKEQMDFCQNALIDANGNGIGNEDEDNNYSVQMKIRREYSPQIDIPYIYDISEHQSLYEETSATLKAGVSYIQDGSEIRRVWAIITPPDFDPDLPDTPVTELPEIELSDLDGDGIYEGTYNNFTQNGIYKITICAMNASGVYALFRNTSVEKGTKYVVSVSEDQILYGSQISADLWASINKSIEISEISRVWAEIISPDLSGEVVETDLYDPEHDGIYENTYTGFTGTGTYIVNIRAENLEGYICPPARTTVTRQGLYLESDKYEDDNIFNLAPAILINDEIQNHNFHAPEDTDWVRFFGIAGNIYKIKTDNPSTICNPVIEVHKFVKDGPVLLTLLEDSEGAGKNRFLDWTCMENALYFVKIRNFDPNISGENVTYDLEIYQPIGEVFGNVQGTITDIIGQPITYAVITTNGGGSDLSRENGYYSIKNGVGSYVLTIEHDKYKAQSIQVTIRENEVIMENITMILSCDVNGDGFVDIKDTILSLQIVADVAELSSPINIDADISEDNRIGMEEAIISLKTASGLR